MAGNIEQIHNRLGKVININFNNPEKIIGIVESVNINEKYFVLKSINANETLECHVGESLDSMQLGSKVIAKGYLKLYPGNINKFYFEVKSMYLQSAESQYIKALETYNKLYGILITKYQTQIDKFALKNPPLLIKNIGLVVLPGSEKELDYFKTEFKQKCLGKLVIYRLKECNLENSLPTMLEYFKKYHSIDIISILSSNLSSKCIYQLSSKKNVVSMFRRKDTPYIVSIINDNDSNEIEPLTVMLSNNKFNNIGHFLNYVQSIQKSYSDNLNNGILHGKNILFQLIEKQRQKITNIKMDFPEWSSFSKVSNSSSNQFDKLKDLLTKSIIQKKLLIKQHQISILNNILSDPRVVNLLSKLADGEKALLETIRPNNKSTVTTRNPSNDILADKFEMERIALNDKKIENKTVDNLIIEGLDINIQYQNGNV